MKLYLENDTEIFAKLKKYKVQERHPWFPFLRKEEKQVEIYSEEGIFQMNPTNHKIFQCKQNENIPVERKVVKNSEFPWLIDKNTWQYQETSYLPFDHISMGVTIYTFSLFELKQKRVKCVLKTLTTRENTEELQDFYFEMFQEMDEKIVGEEIQEFLSSFN